MKAFKKLNCLLLCLPFLFLACEKDNDKTQDELPPAVHEFTFIETALNDYFTENTSPLSIDFKNDQIYIGDIDMNINHFDNDYTYLGLLQTSGLANINANTVRFKRIDGFYVHNQEYNFLMCYDATGHREGEINNLPDLDNQYITAIDCDLFDNVYLIYDSQTIHKYNADLSGPTIIRSNIGDLFEHGVYDFKIMSIAVDNEQNIYISVDVYDDQGEGYDAVLKFDNQLNFLESIGGNWAFNGPCGIAFDDANYMYVVNRWNAVVKVFNNQMELVTMSGEIDLPGADDGLLDEPIGIRIDNKKVYITEKGNHRISVFTSFN
jgi:hypothetical protein